MDPWVFVGGCNLVIRGVTGLVLFSPLVKTRLEDFYNYRDELDTLVNAVQDEITRMAAIKGIRRIGKSSLLRVGLNVAGKPFIIFDIRSAGGLSIDSVYKAFERSLEDAIKRLKPFRAKLSKVESVSLYGSKVSLRSRGPSVISDILGALNEASPGPGGIVVAFDEAQLLSRIRGFSYVLAHAYDYLENIKIVLTGSEVGLLDRLLGKNDPRAPLYGRPVLEISMRRLSREQSTDFLRRGFQEQGIVWREEWINEAVELLDGIPGWLTYYGFYATKTRDHNEALSRTVEAARKTVRAELERFLAPRETARTRYLTLLRCLSVKPMRWSQLRRCMEAELGYRIANPQLYRYTRELMDYSIIEKTSEGYRLADPLIRAALETIY